MICGEKATARPAGGEGKNGSVLIPYIGSYTQNQIAGPDVSESIPVNRDQAERCPPKTTVAAIDG